MSSIQKIIKYIAIAFALFLAFSIISGIVYGISSLENLFDNNDNEITRKLKDLKIDSNASILNIEVASTNLTIKEGNSLKAESNNKYIKIKQNQNSLSIIEKEHNLFSNNKNEELIIYIPSDFSFEYVAITTGASKLNIDKISTKNLDLELGTGKVDINQLIVLKDTEIEGGAGKMTIKDGDIHNLDLEMGIGSLSLTSKLTGNNHIDAGVGEINLNLLGTMNDYNISLDKGIGSATLAGNSMDDNTQYGTGSNKIDIDGGVGSISIDFKKNKY